VHPWRRPAPPTAWRWPRWSAPAPASSPFLFGIPAILGIIFGFVARSQIKNSNNAQGGSGLALAGIIVGFSLIALGILGIILIAVFAHTTCTNLNGTTYNCTN
jgi:Domain of unknown function (DUF4190)